MPRPTKELQRVYCREWIARRRQEWLAANGPCRQCRSWERLEVDHIDPAEKVTHAVWSWAEARRLAELAKCQVLCRNCHKEKTRAHNQRPITHGTRAGYKRGCRCRPCTDACVRYNRAHVRARLVFHLPFCEVCDARLHYVGIGRPPRHCEACKQVAA